jgi:hypothetical protein
MTTNSTPGAVSMDDDLAQISVEGLSAAIDMALDRVRIAQQHLGVLIDEIFHVDYCQGVDGQDLSEHLDTAATQLRAARRAAVLIEAAGDR